MILLLMTAVVSVGCSQLTFGEKYLTPILRIEAVILTISSFAIGYANEPIGLPTTRSDGNQ